MACALCPFFLLLLPSWNVDVWARTMAAILWPHIDLKTETTRKYSTVEKPMVPGLIDHTLELRHQVLEDPPPDWSCHMENNLYPV